MESAILYGLGEGDQRTRRFYVVSTVMGNDEKCLLLRVGFRFSAVDLPAQKFCAGSKRKVANPMRTPPKLGLVTYPK